MNESKELQRRAPDDEDYDVLDPSSLVRPIAKAPAVKKNFEEFQALKQTLLGDEDIQVISGKRAVKKSGWRKIATAFGISDEVVREERVERTTKAGTPYWEWLVTARAIAPNGRHADAMGSCASTERTFAHPDHDTRATAHTRAKSRAISDLVGGGEVSAEEMEHEVRPRLEQTFWETLTELVGKPVNPGNTAHISRVITYVEMGLKAEKAGKQAPQIIDAETNAIVLEDPNEVPGVTVEAF